MPGYFLCKSLPDPQKVSVILSSLLKQFFYNLKVLYILVSSRLSLLLIINFYYLISCCGLDICTLQHLGRNLIATLTALEKTFKGSLGHEDSTLIVGTGVIIKRSLQPPLALSPSALWWQSKKALIRCWNLDIGLPNIRNSEPINFCSL